MSAAFKIAGLASGFTFLSASILFSIRNSQHEFSKNALALDHIGEAQTRGLPKPKVSPNFIPVSIGGYEIKTAA